MMPTRALRATAQRTPMIRFLGKRSAPTQVDHTPAPHPASPSHALPDSFATYRAKAQQHGPLGGQSGGAPQFNITSEAAGGAPRSGKSLGTVEPASGTAWDRSELPQRFWRTPFDEAEIDAVQSGGASMWS